MEAHFVSEARNMSKCVVQCYVIELEAPLSMRCALRPKKVSVIAKSYLYVVD